MRVVAAPARLPPRQQPAGQQAHQQRGHEQAREHDGHPDQLGERVGVLEVEVAEAHRGEDAADEVDGVESREPQPPGEERRGAHDQRRQGRQRPAQQVPVPVLAVGRHGRGRLDPAGRMGRQRAGAAGHQQPRPARGRRARVHTLRPFRRGTGQRHGVGRQLPARGGLAQDQGLLAEGLGEEHARRERRQREGRGGQGRQAEDLRLRQVLRQQGRQARVELPQHQAHPRSGLAGRERRAQVDLVDVADGQQVRGLAQAGLEQRVRVGDGPQHTPRGRQPGPGQPAARQRHDGEGQAVALELLSHPQAQPVGADHDRVAHGPSSRRLRPGASPAGRTSG